MKQAIVTTLTMVDIFGYQPKMLLNNSETLKSPFGGFITACVLITIGISVWLFGGDIVYKEQPNLVVSTYADADPVLTKFSDSNYVFSFGLQGKDYTFFADETIYTAQFQSILVTRDKDGFTNTTQTNLELIRCSEKNISLQHDYFRNLDLKNLLCFKNGTFNIQGYFGTKNWNYLLLSLNRCKNSTENNNSCKSSEEIAEKLSGGYLGIFATDQTVIPSNYSFPYQTFGTNIWTSFSALAYREIWLYYKRLEVLNDLGWITKNYVTQNYFSFDEFKEVWDYRETSDVFLRLGIALSLNRVIYDRSYIKIQTVTANVGGITKFLLVCGQLILFYFSTTKFKSYLVNYFYDMRSFSNKPTSSNLTNRTENKFSDNLSKSKKSFNTHGRINSFDVNLVSNRFKISKVPIKLTRTYNYKMRSLEMGFIETLKSAMCFKLPKKKVKIINAGYEKIRTQFDWINFIKNQNDLEILREIMLNKEQKNILSLAFLSKDKHSLYDNFYKGKFNFDMLTPEWKKEANQSYMKLLEDPENKINAVLFNSLDFTTQQSLAHA